MTCLSETAHHFRVVFDPHHWEWTIPVGFICDCGMTMSNGDGTYLIIEDAGRLHDYECDCQSCKQWFTEVAAQQIKGRCSRCNTPLDDHPVKGTRENGKKDCP